VAEHSPGILEALGLILSTEKKKKIKQKDILINKKIV
jgi:hypothetical protein